jgi:hypothetical protein
MLLVVSEDFEMRLPCFSIAKEQNLFVVICALADSFADAHSFFHHMTHLHAHPIFDCSVKINGVGKLLSSLLHLACKLNRREREDFLMDNERSLDLFFLCHCALFQHLILLVEDSCRVDVQLLVVL